jgi:hypothetical protein
MGPASTTGLALPCPREKVEMDRIKDVISKSLFNG